MLNEYCVGDSLAGRFFGTRRARSTLESRRRRLGSPQRLARVERILVLLYPSRDNSQRFVIAALAPQGPLQSLNILAVLSESVPISSENR